MLFCVCFLSRSATPTPKESEKSPEGEITAILLIFAGDKGYKLIGRLWSAGKVPYWSISTEQATQPKTRKL